MVAEVDAKGDALVKFDGLQARQWVAKRNFARLRAPASTSADQLQEDLAGAFALSQRWQVDGLAEVLGERLERGLRAGSLAATLEVAVLHDASRLRAACLAFAQHSAQVRAAYDARSFTPTVLEALQLAFGTCSGAGSESLRGSKRLREVL
ncbi:unnamed protein product [Polarella glacialis]|uniref:Uncharacterized protein n=1 Tax=Polarella glacialis TaxID=89957 RepID=A0A813DXK5_POLGL|nr:unnamed protein product [Polarella glacialis]